MSKTYLPIPAGLALLAATSASFANDYDQFFDTSFKRSSTSDHKTQNTITTQYKRHYRQTGTIVGTRTRHQRIKEHNRSYDVNQVYVQGAKRAGRNTHLHGGIGQARVEQRGHGQRKTVTTGHAGIRTQIGRHKVNLRHERGLATRHHGLSTKNGKILTHRTNTLEVKMRPHKRVRLDLSHRRGKLNDGNRHRHTKAGAYYGISPDWPYVWAGVEINQRKNSKQTKGYWTPKKHRSATLALDASFPVNQHLNVNSALRVGKAKEEGKRYNETYASVGAKYRLSKRTHVSAEVYNIRSQQSNDKWRENGGTVKVTHKW